MKVFSSGSCRLVTTINHGWDKITPIHSMFYNFNGINFLGKLHNTKQHIQFLKFIKDEITIPDNILPQFLTSYNEHTCGTHCEPIILLPCKKENIKKQIDDCEWYIFEICSLKLYNNSGFEVQHELTNQIQETLQSEQELWDDLHIIRSMLPNKKILFQCHFRPNIIYNDESKRIVKREIIYNILEQFCRQNEKTYLYDPSILLQSNHSLFDNDTHFIQNGHFESFTYMYNNYLTKI